MNPKLLIAECKNFSDDAIECIPRHVKVTKKDINKDQLEWAFKEFDFFWFRLGFRISEELLRLPGRRVTVIICPVTGLDHIDVETCKALNIKIISLKGETEFLKTVRATAELTVGITLALLRKIPQATISVREGKWNRDLLKGNRAIF